MAPSVVYHGLIRPLLSLALIKKIDIELDTAELFCTKTDGKTKYNFNLFASQSNLLEKFIVMKLP